MTGRGSVVQSAREESVLPLLTLPGISVMAVKLKQLERDSTDMNTVVLEDSWLMQFAMPADLLRLRPFGI